MIIIKQISKSLPDKTLFEDLSFKIAEGQKVGLVGPNGVGKTTLLNIIAGLDEPDSGEIILSNEIIGYLPQKLVAKPGTEIGEYLKQHQPAGQAAYQLDASLSHVGLKGINKRILLNHLSGGQKMKVGLAAILLCDPTTLLLDEPTNNLDVESIIWLEKFVQYFPGKVLLISHDRYFLDACVNKVIELDPYTHGIAEYGGNYSAYKIQKEQRHAHQQTDYDLQQAKEQKMRDWIHQKQEQLKYHPSNKVARQLQAMKTRLEREVLSDPIAKPREYQAFKVQSLGDQLHSKKMVLMLRQFALPQLLTIPELFIYGKDRINLLGPNGSGKTTLMKAMLGHQQYFTGELQLGPNIKLGYFSQEHELLNPEEIVVNVFMQLTKNYSEANARSVLGRFLFSKQKVFAPVRALSEGEKARLIIAIIINQKNDFLLLDEPTNHLDLESREVLAEALKEYEGGFLIVSHDRHFLEQIGITRTFRIKDGLLVQK